MALAGVAVCSAMVADFRFNCPLAGGRSTQLKEITLARPQRGLDATNRVAAAIRQHRRDRH